MSMRMSLRVVWNCILRLYNSFKILEYYMWWPSSIDHLIITIHLTDSESRGSDGRAHVPAAPRLS